ncbi:MAG: o-succinylbenzoate synthase [Myxococcota bacterium]
MRILRACVTPVRLALTNPVTTAHGPIRERVGAVLCLSADSGATGWGEALPLPGFGLETPVESIGALERIAAGLAAWPGGDLESALALGRELAGTGRSARAAADVALHDLAARDAGISVAALLAPHPAGRVRVGALVSGADPSAAAADARRAVKRGFRSLKLKLGADDLASDESRVAAVRAAVGDAVRLRVDANGAWKESTAFEAVDRLARYDLELLEQPVAPTEIAALARLRAASSIPIAADEAVADERSAASLIEERAADVLVLKPAALGGLAASRRIAARAQRAGLSVIVTSFLDSSLGIAAALHLAAALPASPLAAGLATAELLAVDLAAPFPAPRGHIRVPISSGLGVAPQIPLRCAAGLGRAFSG